MKRGRENLSGGNNYNINCIIYIMIPETYLGQKGGMLDHHFLLNIFIVYKCYHITYLNHSYLTNKVLTKTGQ